MVSSSRLRARLGSDAFSVVSFPADGDCFYACVSRALGSLGIKTTVKALRKLVCGELDEAHFSQYQSLSVCGVEGFEVLAYLAYCGC